MKSILLFSGALWLLASLACSSPCYPGYPGYPGYLFPVAYPFTDFYGNVGDPCPTLPFGGYGVGEGYPFYPLGYGGYGNQRSYSLATVVPGGVYGHDGCGCDGYGKYGCGC